MPQTADTLRAETAAAEAGSGLKVLSPRAYELIRLMAAEYGGIGFGLMYEDDNYSDSAPLDSQGLLERGLGYPTFREAPREAGAYLRAARLGGMEEMFAIRRIIERKRIPDGPHDPWPRVTFTDWAVELDVLPGRV